jgi:radical SAM superfamily enzyme YgiQ (UPF0313 family)
MPIGLAYFAGALKKSGYQFKVIDAFGERPFQIRKRGDFLLQGLTEKEIAELIPQDTKIIFIYAINIASHLSLVNIIKTVKKNLPEIPIVVVENTQAVTAYSLREAQQDLYENGADFILTGEPETRGVELVESIIKRNVKVDDIDGLGYRNSGKFHYHNPQRKIDNLDELAFPVWDYFPLEKYWHLKYSHGPLETKRYLPILTSRGCPYSCRFCLMACYSYQGWRGRSPKNVVNEIEYFQKRYNVNEFHVEDVNPTVSDIRIRQICKEIIDRNLKVVWKLVSGTKVETIKNEETLELMAKAGCNYISISPETGSSKILNLMNKPFDLGHALRMVRKMHELNIFSQACFVLGFPGETKEDIRLTQKLAEKLTRVGVDEIAVFIITPVPGSQLFSEFKGYYHFSQLNFSPTWRDDYAYLNIQRLKLYAIFFFNKIIFHFFRIAVQPLRFFARVFKTKMEMVPYRALRMHILLWRAKNELCG